MQLPSVPSRSLVLSCCRRFLPKAEAPAESSCWAAHENLRSNQRFLQRRSSLYSTLHLVQHRLREGTQQDGVCTTPAPVAEKATPAGLQEKSRFAAGAPAEPIRNPTLGPASRLRQGAFPCPARPPRTVEISRIMDAQEAGVFERRTRAGGREYRIGPAKLS